ncbi:hypothetical protein BT69DRAFT_1291914 [Atractiella rhizophila]|nr:hypothetical protein BT69DRAFT_1291914 [Atractiella rhizophila]
MNQYRARKRERRAWFFTGKTTATTPRVQSGSSSTRSSVDELIRIASRSQCLRSAFRLLALEKQTSSVSDQPSTTRMLLVIVKLLSERRDWNELKEQVQALSKKHGQLRESTKKMVGAVMEVWEAGKAEEDEREGLTVCLRDVTEGKIFLELERARLTRRLSAMLEPKGEVADA